MKFSISMLKNNKIDESKKETLIDNLLLTVEKTIDMLYDFIELEKFKKSKFLKNQKFNIIDLISEIIEELKIDIERKNITVYTNITLNLKDDSNNIIHANKEWVKKALLNIIHNSVKYNKDNGELFIHIDEKKGGYLITVKDTGIGMDEVEIEHIFKKYHTSGKEKGTGIGLSMAKAVIEYLGGNIAVDSKKNIGTSFFIYIPRVAKTVRIKQLATAVSAFAIVTFFTLDYFYCLIPQTITKKVSKNIIVYKLENNVIASTNINDSVKIIAYRNIFNTKTRTKFILQKADININTNSKPIAVIANGITIKNHGTKFETIANSRKLATSVYEGYIKAKNIDIKANEGMILDQGKIIETKLPEKINNMEISTDKNYNTIVSWESPYKQFSITLSRNKDFSTTPIIKYTTISHFITLNTLDDGKWYISIQSMKNSLYSMPVVKSFLSLKNYQNALKAYNNKDLSLALALVNLSLTTVKNDSFKPYILKAKILFKIKHYKEALKYSNQAYTIDKNDETKYILGKNYFYLKDYKKALDIFQKIHKKNVNDLIAYCYYYLNNFQKAKKHLYKALEENPKNKQALQYLIKILKKENNLFLLNSFKEQLKDIK